MRTQNANECYNGKIWRRCPKTVGTSRHTVETAVSMASLDFNIGPNGYGMVLEKMNVETGIHLDAHILRSTKRRRADATCHASEQLKREEKLGNL